MTGKQSCVINKKTQSKTQGQKNSQVRGLDMTMGNGVRILSDILLQYGVEMVNVFDTMAAHFVFARWLTVKEMTR